MNEEIKIIYESMLVENKPSKKDIMGGLTGIVKEEQTKKQVIDAINEIYAAVNKYETLISNEIDMVRKVYEESRHQAEVNGFTSELNADFFYTLINLTSDLEETLSNIDKIIINDDDN